eukprot:3940249-Rhodomonas_salina.1
MIILGFAHRWDRWLCRRPSRRPCSWATSNSTDFPSFLPVANRLVAQQQRTVQAQTMLFPKRQGGPGGAKSGLNFKDTSAQNKKKRAPKLEDLVEKRDWSGALGLLQWQLNDREGKKKLLKNCGAENVGPDSMEGMLPISEEESQKDQKEQEKQDINEKRELRSSDAIRGTSVKDHSHWMCSVLCKPHSDFCDMVCNGSDVFHRRILDGIRPYAPR